MSESDTTNDGGPAFPWPSLDDAPGMSLRDWFATHAPELPTCLAVKPRNGETADAYLLRVVELETRWRLLYAHVMLMQRDRDIAYSHSWAREMAEKMLANAQTEN